MPTPNPYIGRPGSAFWKTGVAEVEPTETEGLYRPKFEILANDRIVTAGSCFAQHISRRLKANGYNVLDAEPAVNWLPEDQHSKFGFSTYSARYGNIYTLPHLTQLARECRGDFKPQGVIWTRGKAYIDALRPAIEPDGYESPQELTAHRSDHLSAVRGLFESMDVLIFTLGLVEGWVHSNSGTVVPIAPGVLGDTEETFEARIYGYPELHDAFEAFLATLSRLRGERGPPRIILTVSPVPLTATASGSHILMANTNSKAVLRALAGALAARHPFVDYFPAYEIVTHPAAKGAFFEANLRSVRPEGVEAVMATFFAAHPPIVGTASPSDLTTKSDHALDTELACEEAILEAFSNA